MTKTKVFLTGGDGIGWAVDEDLKLTQQAVASLVDLTDLQEATLVHAVYWWGLLGFSDEQLQQKQIICHVPGEPFRYLTVPEHRRAMGLVSHWITRTSQAAGQLQALGIESDVVPYLIDTSVFRPLQKDDAAVEALRSEWNLPRDAYLIGSFQRDTEGADLQSPKLVKGPDVLMEIFRGLVRRGLNVHLVLAGPRRQWMLRTLETENLPHTYIGKPATEDDIESNTLPRETLNILYNLVDLCVVASRSEGGPHALLEAAASRCKVISTPVGMARDLLEPTCVYRTFGEAIRIVEHDISGDLLKASVPVHFERALERHRPESVVPLFQDIYERAASLPLFTGIRKRKGGSATVDAPSGSVSQRKSPDKPITVGLWHTFYKPPYGGGNQFMMALRKGLLAKGVDVRENELNPDIDAYVLNSIHFDVDRFLEFSRTHRLNVIHRIDGPIHLIRGFDREKDELCYQLNDQFASATVLQSAWVYQRIFDMGYRPIDPLIVHNAVDPDVFNARGRIPFDTNRKIRLISSSWSNNPRKGGPVYKWIEDHLDWSRFEYTFVGNASEEFRRIKHIPPVSSEELADILRQHDIYITASRNDPCSNALIEALACGLPALFLNDGGHPELVGCGGLPFVEAEEIPAQLDRMVEGFEGFQRLITVSTLESVTEKYLTLIKEVIQ
jgi:glycosyltransferase involved in cell wall biosynthesis